MSSVKIKINSATPEQLNWLTALAQLRNPCTEIYFRKETEKKSDVGVPWQAGVGPFEPATNRAQASVIIEAEHIDVLWLEPNLCAARLAFDPQSLYSNGPTPMVAALRTYCTQHFGQHGSVPLQLAIKSPTS